MQYICKINITALLCFWFVSVTAQLAAGLKAGANLSRFSDSDLGEVKWKTSFHAGCFAEYDLKKNKSVQAEILYSRIGALLKTDEDVRYIINTIAAPFSVKHNFKNNLSVTAGLQPSVLLTRIITDGELEISTTSFFRSFDLAWLAGVDYRLPQNPVIISGRFVRSLLNNSGDNDFTIRHNIIMLSVAYILRQKHH